VAAPITVDAGGQLRIEGAGIGVAPNPTDVRARIFVWNGGQLEFASSAAISIPLGGATSSMQIVGGSQSHGPGSIVFRDQSSAGPAAITLPEGNTLSFLDNSSAGTAEITGTGTIRFGGNSTASNAFIITEGSLIFEDHASAGTARLIASLGVLNNHNLTAGKIIFKDQVRGNDATIDFDTDSATLDLSGGVTTGIANVYPNTGRALLADQRNGPTISPNDPFTFVLGGIEVRPSAGSTAIYLGGNRLVLGNNNRDLIEIPTLHDGGLYGSLNGERLTGGGITKTGTGLLQISQINDNTGATVIGQGELRLTGKISKTSISASGLLTGRGTVAGDLTNVRGTIAPGLPNGYLIANTTGLGPEVTLVTQRNPIGTLTVLGNLDIESGSSFGFESRLAIEIAGPNEFDRLNVSGSAKAGGVLQLSLINGYVPVGTSSYLFLSAAGVTSPFDRVALGPGWGYLLTPELLYDSSGVTLRVQQKPMVGLGTTTREQALGRHLDQTISSSTGEYRNLAVTLNGLASAADVTSALQALSPEPYEVLPEYGFFSALAHASALDPHFRGWREAATRPGLELYFDAGYRRSVFTGVAGGTAEHVFRTQSGVAGAAWRNEAWTAGAELAYETGDTSFDSGGKAEVKSLRPAVFLQYGKGAWYCNGSFAFSRDDYELARTIAFPGFARTATASPTGRRADLALTAGYTMRVGPGEFTPSAGLLHSAWKLDDFSETGAAGANLAFSNWSNHSTRSRIGFDVSQSSGSGRFTCGATLLWWHEFSDDRSFEARFVGANTSYLAPGRPAPKDLAQGKISIQAQAGANAIISASVEGLWGEGIKTGPNFAAGLGWTF
jgi:outer membrane autotransporter protein